MLELEDIARIRLATERGTSLPAELAARGLTRAQWVEAERRWLEALALEVEAGTTSLAERYLALYLGAPAAPEAARLTPLAEPAPAEAPRPLIPSYLQIQAARPQPPAPAPVAAPAPMAAPAAATPVVTAELTTPTPARPLSVQERLERGPPPATSGPLGGVTLNRDDTAAPASLPFRSRRRSSGTEDLPTPSTSGGGRRRRAEVALPPHIAALKGQSVTPGGTAAIDDRKASEPALPFADSSRSPAVPPAPAPAAPSSPPPATAAGPSKRLSVDQFAWLVVTVESAPPHAHAEILARMRMSEAEYAALSAAWRGELERDSALAARYAAAVAAERSKRGWPR